MTSPERMRFRQRVFISLAALATVLAFVAVSTVVLYALKSNQDDAQSAKNLAKTIQTERFRASLINCNEVNARNRATVKRLNELISKLPVSRRARARRNVKETKLLIDALVPVRNCVALANRQVRQAR